MFRLYRNQKQAQKIVLNVPSDGATANMYDGGKSTHGRYLFAVSAVLCGTENRCANSDVGKGTVGRRARWKKIWSEIINLETVASLPSAESALAMCEPPCDFAYDLTFNSYLFVSMFEHNHITRARQRGRRSLHID